MQDGHDWFFITHTNSWTCKTCGTKIESPVRPEPGRLTFIGLPVGDSPLLHSTRLVTMTCAEIQVWRIMSS